MKSGSIRLASVAVAAIHRFNRMRDHSKDPDVILELRRMFRKLGRHQNQAAAINKDALDRLIEATDQNLRGYRDRALLLTAYDSLCRRSELAAFRVEDIAIATSEVGMKIKLKRSKSDQEALGQWITLKQETWLAIEDWLRESKISSGYLFRGVTKFHTPTTAISGAQINRIFKRLSLNAKFDKALVSRISGHSLRVGSALDLLNDGASLAMIMSKGRWTKVDTVMRYIKNIK